MWHFTSPPDTSFHEGLLPLSIQNPQMKSYIKRFWRSCVSSTLKWRGLTNIHTHTHTHWASFVFSLTFLSFFSFLCQILPTVAEGWSVSWCKSRSIFESWYQCCLFLNILLNSENCLSRVCPCFSLFFFLYRPADCHVTSVFAYHSWTAMWVRVTCSGCSGAVDATWSLQWTFGK